MLSIHCEPCGDQGVLYYTASPHRLVHPIYSELGCTPQARAKSGRYLPNQLFSLWLRDTYCRDKFLQNDKPLHCQPWCPYGTPLSYRCRVNLCIASSLDEMTVLKIPVTPRVERIEYPAEGRSNYDNTPARTRLLEPRFSRLIYPAVPRLW
jgi:hypothetical protein